MRGLGYFLGATVLFLIVSFIFLDQEKLLITKLKCLLKILISY